MAIFEALLEKLRRAADRRLPDHLRDARRGEDLAYEHVRERGYTIVARNFRPRHGREEIDLIGWDGDYLAIIEVKTRRSEERGDPAHAVGSEKRRHLIRAALEYSRRSRTDAGRLRFDIVSVILEPAPKVWLQKNAFSMETRRRSFRWW